MACAVEFEDYSPLMVEKMGEDGLMQELAKGFHLLANPSSHTIAFQSLKSNTVLHGLPQMSDEELHDMVRLGDSNGRGELDLHDFCVTMFRVSPAVMNEALSNIMEDYLSETDYVVPDHDELVLIAQLTAL
ncbi:hypothetical protein KP509_18G067100 [Ceratopteris richardii]|uniref:EF-hand domain-containing protein n=1 Tax=Ceratopteris richardii TaxID=49495 RepID=A0A8T2STU8_CERRI|nr:hypothetical protein KP509_18G067100 [Ceratopteris richardii]